MPKAKGIGSAQPAPRDRLAQKHRRTSSVPSAGEKVLVVPQRLEERLVRPCATRPFPFRAGPQAHTRVHDGASELRSSSSSNPNGTIRRRLRSQGTVLVACAVGGRNGGDSCKWLCLLPWWSTVERVDRSVCACAPVYVCGGKGSDSGWEEGHDTCFANDRRCQNSSSARLLTLINLDAPLRLR